MTSTVRDDFREDARSLFTGERTIGDSFPAPLAFVVGNALWGLGAASVVALAIGAVVAAWRIRRGQRTVYAMGGIAAIGFAALLALRSGRAEDYFLPGIIGTFAWTVVFVASIVVRRPIGALASWFIHRWPITWYWRNDVRPAYARVTIVWTVYFALRGLATWVLYVQGRPELLAVVKVVTSWPMMLPLLLVSYVWGNGMLHKLGGPNVDEHVAGAGAPYEGGQRGF